MFTLRSERYIFLAEVFSSLTLIVVIAIWLETNLDTRAQLISEDHLIEYLTAIFFGLSSLGFVVILARSTFLRECKFWWRYFFTFGWAVALFLAMGEEISWGQRILGFETPEFISEINTQDEFNIHNISFGNFGGWTVQWFALQFITFVPGVILPISATTKWVPRLIQKLAFPVIPLGFVPIFFGSWLLQTVYSPVIYNSNDLMEIREFLLATGLLCFALHGSLRSSDLFRLPPVGTPPKK